MNKQYPALCKDCMWSRKFALSATLRCHHPNVVGIDPWALSAVTADGDPYGVDCLEERRKKWFCQGCTMQGKLWEPVTG